MASLAHSDSKKTMSEVAPLLDEAKDLKAVSDAESLADAFGYSFLKKKSGDDPDDHATSRLDFDIEDNPFADIDDDSYYEYEQDNVNVPPVAAMASLMYGVFCFVIVALLIVGFALLSIDPYKPPLTEKEIAARVLISLGVFILLLPCICCGSLLFMCAAAAPNLIYNQHSDHKHWKLKRLNDQYRSDIEDLTAMRFDVESSGDSVKTKHLRQGALEKKKKEEKKLLKKKREDLIKKDIDAGLTLAEIQNKRRPIVFKIVFDGDIYVSTIDDLREQISLCLKSGSPQDTICLVLTSGGGSVTMYGLAAAQLGRIRKAGMRLVICVDSIAASGGYLMAVMGNSILASPFAMVGSIGVVSIVPNVQKLLDKYGINTYVFTAGEFKRTVDIIGDVSDKGKKKMLESIESIHESFKDHVCLVRPVLKPNIDKISTGEVWLGVKGKELGLVDDLMTSDEFLIEQAKTHDVIEVKKKPKSTLSKILDSAVSIIPSIKAMSKTLTASTTNGENIFAK